MVVNVNRRVGAPHRLIVELNVASAPRPITTLPLTAARGVCCRYAKHAQAQLAAGLGRSSGEWNGWFRRPRCVNL